MTRASTLIALVVLAGCPSGPGGKGDTATQTQGWCAVRDTLDANCTVCHGGNPAQGNLDLATDAYGALVNVPSPGYPGRTLVIPGDPDGSFLVVKMEGTQTVDEGNPMPQGNPLSADAIAAVRAWIADGATDACDAPVDTDVNTTRFHPDGWAEPTAHGFAADRQDLDCLSCHGNDLGGGTSGISCDSCHSAGWRTHCTYCHGGTANATGAPPEDVLGQSDPAQITFPPHTSHVTRGNHAAFDCTQCHVKPADVLSAGHFLVNDATPGIAENDFSRGLSPSGSWSNGSGTCSNLYCHGTGRANGTAQVGTVYTCGSCHADASSSASAISGMSGQHSRHLGKGILCSECHSATASNGETISNPDNHVNGVVDVALPTGMRWNAGSCTGLCHFQVHFNKTW